MLERMKLDCWQADAFAECKKRVEALKGDMADASSLLYQSTNNPNWAWALSHDALSHDSPVDGTRLMSNARRGVVNDSVFPPLCPLPQ